MHKRWHAITLGFALAMLLQGNAAAGVMLLQVKIGYAAGLPPFSVAALPHTAVSLPAPITHFFRRGNSYGLMGGWEHASRLLPA